MLMEPPPLNPPRIFPGGDMQTVAAAMGWRPGRLSRRTVQQLSGAFTQRIAVDGGDEVAIHINRPLSSAGPDANARPATLLVHGISGCHAADYMLRIASFAMQRGHVVARMDNRGCGVTGDRCRGVSHAGRGEDVAAALSRFAGATEGTIDLIGISLGGNQLLDLASRVGAGHREPPPGWGRVRSLVAVCPPIDLQRCADNMDRLRNRIYNRYFIRGLLRRAPVGVRRGELFRNLERHRAPRTLRELDERLTAPLSGFDDAADYYRHAATRTRLPAIDKPTYIIAAKNDPIVPRDCFDDAFYETHSNVHRMMVPRGGHVGFMDRHDDDWLARCVMRAADRSSER